MSDIEKKLDSLRDILRDRAFLSGEGLANEVNIRMFNYDPADEMIVRSFTRKILAMSPEKLGCNLKEVNLYKLFLRICESKDILDAIPEMEDDDGSRFLLEELTQVVDLEEDLIPLISYPDHKNGDVLLITGIGEAYPFIRVHGVLSAMQQEFSDVPIVVMYPGKYNGSSLKLFDKLKTNAYYRSFNLV